MNANSEKIESLDRTVLDVGGTDVVVTLADVKAIQAALLAYLKQSSYEDRDSLLGWTQGLAWIDADGKARIGPWLLGSDGQGIFLRYREQPGQHMAKAHRASVTKKEGTWTVTNVVAEHISVRR